MTYYEVTEDAWGLICRFLFWVAGGRYDRGGDMTEVGQTRNQDGRLLAWTGAVWVEIAPKAIGECPNCGSTAEKIEPEKDPAK